MSSWRRCEKCRKVRATEEYDGESTTCRECLTAPAPRVRASPVTRTRTVARPQAQPTAPAGPRLGTIGSGDLEVRERRARRAATDALVELHAEEFDQLLAAARGAEGLRA